MKNNSLRKQQVFVAIQLAEILETNAFSQWNHVKVTHNSADVGTRAINLEELKKASSSLVRPGWGNQKANYMSKLTYFQTKKSIPATQNVRQ